MPILDPTTLFHGGEEAATFLGKAAVFLGDLVQSKAGQSLVIEAGKHAIKRGFSKTGSSAPRYSKRRRLDSSGRYQRGGYYGRYRDHKVKEMKFKDFFFHVAAEVDHPLNNVWHSMVNLHHTAGTTHLQEIGQGNKENERNGRRLTITKINLKGEVYMKATNDADTSKFAGFRLRIVVVIDRQTNGTVPKIEDIFEFDNVPTGSNHTMLYRNLANVERFEVIMDKTMQVNHSAVGKGTSELLASARKVIPFAWQKTKLNLPIDYDETLGVKGEIITVKSNGIFTFYVFNNGRDEMDTQNISQYIDMKCNWRVRFKG